MAVAIVATDTWISHLLFTGGRRQTIQGPVDGMWYGLVAGDGDASAGNLTLNGLLSFDRKEDWVYLLGGLSSSVNGAGGDAFSVVNTGPLIPTSAVATLVQNPSFHQGGQPLTITGNAVTPMLPLEGGPHAQHGMPIFGDKRIAGSFGMCAVGWQTNTDGATYQMSAWGWLVNYSSFFRNVDPRVG